MLCVYKDGVFKNSCNLHKQIAALRKELEKAQYDEAKAIMEAFHLALHVNPCLTALKAVRDNIGVVTGTKLRTLIESYIEHLERLKLEEKEALAKCAK